MLERSLRVINELGIHARAAAQLVRLASGFDCSITLERGDNGGTADAKSILSLLHLAAGFDVRLRVIADGEDEADALEAVGKLFQEGFGEI